MTARADMVDRIERALDAHEPATTRHDPERGDLIRCTCQPRDAVAMPRNQWRHHVAEECVAKALRIY